jgi:hypothetical protein
MDDITITLRRGHGEQKPNGDLGEHHVLPSPAASSSPSPAALAGVRSVGDRRGVTPNAEAGDGELINIALRRLRTHSGWWEGDTRGRQVLTELLEAAKDRGRREVIRALLPAIESAA